MLLLLHYLIVIHDILPIVGFWILVILCNVTVTGALLYEISAPYLLSSPFLQLIFHFASFFSLLHRWFCEVGVKHVDARLIGMQTTLINRWRCDSCWYPHSFPFLRTSLCTTTYDAYCRRMVSWLLCLASMGGGYVRFQNGNGIWGRPSFLRFI